MNKIVDKIIIFVLSVFVMSETLTDNSLLVMIYLSIALSAIHIYLLTRDREDYRLKPEGSREWIAVLLQGIISVLSLLYAPFVLVIPLLLYDVAKSRNYIAASCSLLGIANTCLTGRLDDRLLCYIIVISILSLLLSIYCEKRSIMHVRYYQLRDDSAEMSERLRTQNMELIHIRDSEVYTAQLAERNRIARDIHDNVGHMLSRALLQMGALLAIHKEEPIHTELEGVRETLDTAMNNIRSSVHDLHDESIDIGSAMEELSRPLTESGRFRLNLELDAGDDMPREVKYALIGITKECVSNVIKHSDNKQVDINLTEHPSMYQLVVHDYPAASDAEEDEDTTGRQESQTEVSEAVFDRQRERNSAVAAAIGRRREGAAVDEAAIGRKEEWMAADEASSERRRGRTSADETVIERQRGRTNVGEAGNRRQRSGTTAGENVAGISRSSEGIGLLNIASRVESLGGTLHISTDQGYRVFVSIPK